MFFWSSLIRLQSYLYKANCKHLHSITGSLQVFPFLFRLALVILWLLLIPAEKLWSLIINASSSLWCRRNAMLHCKCFYRALRVLCRFSLMWGNPVIFTDCGKSYNYHGVSLQSVNITGFIHNIHRVSLWFLQPFSIR